MESSSFRIQPSGRLHLGNYLGALKNFVDLQNSGEYDRLYFFIADYHSLTEDFDPKEKRSQILMWPPVIWPPA